MMPASYRDIMDVDHESMKTITVTSHINETWYCEYTKSINFVRRSCQWVLRPHWTSIHTSLTPKSGQEVILHGKRNLEGISCKSPGSDYKATCFDVRNWKKSSILVQEQGTVRIETCRPPETNTAPRTVAFPMPDLESRSRHDITPMISNPPSYNEITRCDVTRVMVTWGHLYIRTCVTSWTKSVMSHHVQICDDQVLHQAKIYTQPRMIYEMTIKMSITLDR